MHFIKEMSFVVCNFFGDNLELLDAVGQERKPLGLVNTNSSINSANKHVFRKQQKLSLQVLE